MIKDILLHLNCHPDSTSHAAIDEAVAIAATLGARITALAFHVDFPVRRTVLSDLLIDVEAMAERERKRCLENARDLLGRFEERAAALDVTGRQIVHRCLSTEVADVVTEHARVADLVIVPVAPSDSAEHFLAETVIFGSGRPVLILPDVSPMALVPPDPPPRPRHGLERVGIAWDFSRPAARAVGDAIPILQRARSVRVVTVTGEKAIRTRMDVLDLTRHLAHHGVDAVVEETGANGRAIGEVLAEFAADQDLDLLVMGAYGHSRLREFVLGGATMTMLRKPALPLLLSH